MNFSMPLTIQGTGNATVTSNNQTHTVYINVAVASGKNGQNGTNGSNGTTITPLTCALDYQVHGITVSGTVATIHCAINNSTGSTTTLDTMANIGTGGFGFYAGNTTNTHFTFRNLTSARSDLFTLSQTASNVILNSVFKSANISCGAGHFIQSFDNTTGVYTCALDSGGTITGGSNIGTSGFGFFKDSSGNTINLRNLTTSRSDLFTLSQSSSNVNLASSFKSNTIICSNQFISAFNNATGVYTCNTPTDTIQNVGGGQASIYKGNNTDTNFQFKTVSVIGSGTISNGSSLLTITTKTYQNNTASNVGHGGKGFASGNTGSVINLRNMTSLRTDLLTVSQNLTDVNLSSLFKSLTKTCGAGTAITAYDNTTGIYTCSAFGGGTITGGSNIGTSGYGFFKDSSGNTINLRNLTTTRSDLFTISQSANNVNLASALKTNSKTCSDGQAISTYSNSSDQTCSPFGNATSINDLGDVVISSPIKNQTLSYNSATSQWKNINSTIVNLQYHNATSAESRWSFIPSKPIDCKSFSQIQIIFTGEATSTLALQLRLNGHQTATEYTEGGVRSGATTVTSFTVASATAFQLASSTVMATGSPTEVEAHIHCPLTNNKRMDLIGTAYSEANSPENYGGAFAVSQQISITNMTFVTSTSTWKVGSQFNIYGVHRLP